VIEIDGSMLSGSGTLLRYATAFATIRQEPLHMVRIRAKRAKPGLRPQHLLALKRFFILPVKTSEAENSVSILERPVPRRCWRSR